MKNSSNTDLGYIKKVNTNTVKLMPGLIIS